MAFRFQSLLLSAHKQSTVKHKPHVRIRRIHTRPYAYLYHPHYARQRPSTVIADLLLYGTPIQCEVSTYWKCVA